MWRLGVVRSELLHAAASLLQAVGLVLAVRLRLPRGGVVGVPGSAAEHRHYRGAVGWLAQLDAALPAHAATQPDCWCGIRVDMEVVSIEFQMNKLNPHFK